MSDDKKSMIIEGEILPPEVPSSDSGSGIWTSMANRVTTRARRREMEEANALAEQAVQNKVLEGRYVEAERDVAIQRDMNENIDQYTSAARNDIANHLDEQAAQKAELDLRTQTAKAAADEVIGKHEANVAEEKARKEAAELAAMELQLKKDRLRRQMDQEENNRAGILAKVQAELNEAEVEEAGLKDQLASHMNSDHDGDPSHAHKVKIIRKSLADLESRLASLRQRAEKLK